jgi:hypothetical protein
MQKRNLILLGMMFLLLAISLSSSVAYAEDDGEGEHEGEGELGTTAFAIFGVCCIYIIVYQIFILSRKLPKEDERSEKLKKSIGDFHKIVRKPLSLLHYIAGTIAIVILWIHGLSLIGEEGAQVVYGVTTASLLTFFVVSGLIIKLMPGKSKVVIGLKKILRKIHTNLIFFLIVLAPHLIHISMGGE